MGIQDSLLSHHNQVIKWLAQPEAKPFLDFLVGWQEQETSLLRKASGEELYRVQGRSQVLERILGLKKELREYGDRLLEENLKKEGSKS